jgi:hypothetical protein
MTNPYDQGRFAPVPGQVKAVRILLFVVAGLTVLTLIGFLLSGQVSAESAGLVIWASLPGVIGLVVALRLARGGRVRFWVVVVVAALLVLGGLGALGRGDPRGITNLILPGVILFLVTRRPAREFFLS